MKKKVVSLLLVAVMAMGLLTACGDKDTTGGEATGGEVTGGEVVATSIPEAKYYYSFEDATGLTLKVNDFTSEGATTVETRIIDTDKTLLHTEGVKGQCAYFDGSYGAELDIDGVGDTYSISFWMNAARFSDYGPVVQFGSDLYSANLAATWVNITKASWVGDSFPTIWSRNEAADIFPWFNAEDGVVFGKKEWIHVVLVADAADMTADGIFVNGKVYVNGEEKFHTDAEGNRTENQLTPGVFNNTDSFHFYLGINCWDTIFKGAIDELYIFDKALTAGEVLALYQDGDGTKTLVAPESPSAVEDPVIVLPEITVDAAAVETIGAVTRDNGFWTETTTGTAIADGETKTVTLKNYSNGEANWNNFVLAFANTATTRDLLASGANYEGYAEYAVMRADCYAWGGNIVDATGAVVADPAFAFTSAGSWGADWPVFANMMLDSDVTVTITRNGADLVVNCKFVAADGTEYTSDTTLTSRLTAADDCYFFFTGEKCYVEVLSIN